MPLGNKNRKLSKKKKVDQHIAEFPVKFQELVKIQKKYILSFGTALGNWIKHYNYCIPLHKSNNQYYTPKERKKCYNNHNEKKFLIQFTSLIIINAESSPTRKTNGILI